MRKHYRNSQVQGEPNKQTFVSGDIKLWCLITIKTGNNIYLFITKYSLLRLHLVSRKIFTYFQWGVETNLAKIQQHNTVQGYNSEENPFKIILFLCCRRILVRSATFDSHPSSNSTWQVLDPTGQLQPGPGDPKGAQKGARRAPQKNLSSRLEACCV